MWACLLASKKSLSLPLPLPLSFSITLALGLSLSRSFLEILGLLGTASFLAAACLSFFEIHLCSFLLLHLLPFFCFPCRQFLKSKALLISSGLVRSSRLLHFHIPPLPRAAAAAAVVAVAVGAAAAAARCSPGFSSRPKKTSVIGFRLRDRDGTSRRERMDNFF